MKERKYSLSLLSKHRTKIMGFAMLWIMLFHCSGDFRDIPVVGLIKYYGNVGVDMFLVLSGIGLYYSAAKLSKASDGPGWIWRFYGKRILRILPATIICLLPWYLYLGRGCVDNIGRFIFDITSLSFFADGQNRGWYAALSLLLYFVYPLIYLVISASSKKDGSKARLWAAMFFMIAADICINICIFRAFPESFSYLDIALCRIPVFIAGCFLAVPVKAGKEITPWCIGLFAALATFCVFVLEKYSDMLQGAGTWRYLYGIAGLCMCFILSFLFEKLRWKWLHSIFDFTGKYTLELYLTHTQFLTVFLDLAYANFGESFAVTMACNGAAVIASFLAAVLLRKILKAFGL